MIGGTDQQILSGVWTEITNNFTSGTIFWGIILLLDFVVAAYRYHKTREVAEFIKTFVLMLVITAGVTLIFTYVKSS